MHCLGILIFVATFYKFCIVLEFIILTPFSDFMSFPLEILVGTARDPQRAETVTGAQGCLSSPGGKNSVAGLVNS